MDRSKLRISKACQECRARKIRCDGGEPCERCRFRDVPCEYRKKARNRMKKSDRLGLVASSSTGPDTPQHTPYAPASTHPSPQKSQHPQQEQQPQPQTQQHQQLSRQSWSQPQQLQYPTRPWPGSRGVQSSLQNASVAATHRASPCVSLQLYYGPSSNFTLLNSIYHKIEGTQPGPHGHQRRHRNHSNRHGGNNSRPGSKGLSGSNMAGDDGMDGDHVDHDDVDRDNTTDSSADESGESDDGDNEDNDNNDGTPKGVEEIGPGLDLFNTRRLYFGDLAGGTETSFRVGGNGSFTDGAAMFVGQPLAKLLLERYLYTFWLVLPIWTRDTFRQRLDAFYESSSLLVGGNPDTVIVLLALSLGASMLEEEMTAQYLFQMAKKWANDLDEMVNVQTVQISLMMSHFMSERARPNSSFLQAGIAVRKAVAAGLHKGILGGAGSAAAANNAQAQEAARQMRITIWSLYFWEIWICFSLGRPSSFPEAEMDVPFPTEEKLLHSVVTLARIMSKAVTCIYRSHHDSLLPMWNAANDIRRELRQFAEKQREDFNFGVVDDPTAGELGVCQTIVSTLYHHTLILTFRPFLVFRAKLRRKDADSHPSPPPWLDTACEYCLDAARHAIAFMIRAFDRNELCRAIRYHAFFIEGASHVLAFEFLHNKNTRESIFPWLQLAIRALLLSRPRNDDSLPLPVDLAATLERIIQSVYPDFHLANFVDKKTGHWGGPGAGFQNLNQQNRDWQLQQKQQQQQQQQQQVTYPHQQAYQVQQQAQQQQQVPDGPHGPHDANSAALGTGFTPTNGLVRGAAGGFGAVNGTAHGTGSSASASSTPVRQPPQLQPQQLPPPVPIPQTMPDLGGPANGGSGSLNLNNLNSLDNLNSLGHIGDLSSLGGRSNALPPLLFPFTPFGGLDDVAGSSTQPSPNDGTAAMGSTGGASNGTAGAVDAPADLTAADLGWNQFDFSTMNMEAFLSIDPNMQATDFNMFR